VKLKVEVSITPHPRELGGAQIDRLFDGELSKFQDWVQQRNRAVGMEGAALSAPERLIVKSYLLYAATDRIQED
jgi:hypothetical protein